MKKFNVKFLLIQVAIMFMISLVASVVISLAIGGENIVNMIKIIIIMAFFFVVIFYLSFGYIITGSIAKKTMEKYSEENNFDNCSTFVTEGSFMIGGIIRIDENDGRIGYVSYQNPYEFQMAMAKDVMNIKSSYIKGPLGGTNYVYFEFYYKNKRVRIPTFTANNAYSLKSAEVLEGISKADAFCAILESAQKAM